MIAGIRTQFVYNIRKLDVAVFPDEDDLRKAETVDVLRLWATVAQWAESLKTTNPGWTVGGERTADPDFDPPDEMK